MPRLLLVRHAQSKNNLSNARIREELRDDPERMHAEAARAREPDPDLSELGRAQAERVAEHLAPILSEPRSLLVSSPMRRALQTATPIAARVGLERFVCEAGLFEVGGCHYCGELRPSATAAALEAEFPVRCGAMDPEGWYAGHGGAETSDEARARVERAIAWAEATLAAGTHETVVVIAHGDLLSRWLRRWLHVPWQRGLAFVHGNTGITTLSWDRREGLLLEGFNSLTHLPPKLRSGADAEFWWRYAWPDLELSRYESWAAIPGELAVELAELRARHLLEPEGKSLADYATSDARSVHLVALAEGELAGYVQYDPELGRLRQLVVGPRHRRSRLGRRLVGAVEDEARRDGRDELLVHAWVDSVGFYAALGFVARGAVESGAPVAWQAMVKQGLSRTC
ncbi:bifunctional RNase H/acid phosphatase [Enhygromyxa salina]|uniref:Bifunctional RNase H/acid phosphatase n=1 Tax=Enhygromyxa salina TaxID=215803 RepID=A0A2S9XJP5_9BACT|nr:GNAT family N-acetyltransferase [Enhygromyxa salina]PRP93057.1 bifunctional RNase H/acid phosphatase [Enhygromyxa salina]